MAWSVRRRPNARLLIVGAAIGLALGAGGAWLLPALMTEPKLAYGLAAGAGIAALTIAILAAGSTASVDDAGILRYGFGNRVDVEVPLAACSGWIAFDQGLFRAIGCRVDAGQVKPLSRKVVTPARMTAWKQDLGVDLVLEHLTAADAEELQRLSLAAS